MPIFAAHQKGPFFIDVLSFSCIGRVRGDDLHHTSQGHGIAAPFIENGAKAFLEDRLIASLQMIEDLSQEGHPIRWFFCHIIDGNGRLPKGFRDHALGNADVDADANDKIVDVTKFSTHFRQDAYKLASFKQNVIRPFDFGLDAAQFTHSADHRNGRRVILGAS